MTDIKQYYTSKKHSISGQHNVAFRHKLGADFFRRRDAIEILDVGGNDGCWAEVFRSIQPEGTVDSVELSDQFSDHAKSLRKCYQFDATEPWPISSESYDGIHLGAIVEHVFDYNTLFAECFRVLRLGGTIFISTPNMASLRHRYQIIRGRMPVWYKMFEHIRPWTADHLKNVLEHHGFMVLSAYGTSPGGGSKKLSRRFLEQFFPLMCGILIVEATKPITNCQKTNHQ